jgi:hypothetical protein
METVRIRDFIETPAFDGVLTAVQYARTREFRWFIGLWANFFFPRPPLVIYDPYILNKVTPARGRSPPIAQRLGQASSELALKIL